MPSPAAATSESTRSHHQDSSRFTSWVSLSILSAVSLAAVVSDIRSDNISKNSAETKWILSVCSISLILSSFLSVATRFVSDDFALKKPELFSGFLLLVLWIAALPTIMGPNNDFAMSGIFVVNSNLYFGSWGCLGCSLMICGNVCSGQMSHSAEPLLLSKWYVVAAASVLLLASSIEFHESYEEIGCSSSIGKEQTECKRNLYAIALGAMGSLMALSVSVFAKCISSLRVETAVAFVLFLLYAVGVGYITFGDGPGTVVGNLYFSTWIGFLVVLLICIEGVRQLMQERSEQSSQEYNNDEDDEGGVVIAEAEVQSHTNYDDEEPEVHVVVEPDVGNVVIPTAPAQSFGGRPQ